MSTPFAAHLAPAHTHIRASPAIHLAASTHLPTAEHPLTYDFTNHTGSIQENFIAHTPEDKRTYSSVKIDDKPGTGHAQSALNGPQGWSISSSKLEADDEWIQLDLGETKLVAGTAIQPRADNNEHVTSYTVSYSLDGADWTDIDDIFHGTETGIAMNTFSAPVLAKYVRLWPRTGVEWISMRADALLCTPFIANTPEDKRTYSSTYKNCAPGHMFAQSAIDSPSPSWWALVCEDQWLQIDLENPRLVAGAVLQKAKGYVTIVGQAWVTSYTVSYSLDGDEWTGIDGTFEIDETKHLTEAIFPVAVLARYVRMNPKTWDSWVAMRGDVLVVAGYVPIIAMIRIITAFLHIYLLKYACTYSDV